MSNNRIFRLPPLLAWTMSLLFSILAFNASGQSQKQLIKVGDQLFNQGDYYGASKWYNDALQMDSNYLELRFKYAEALRLYNDYQKAEPQYYYLYKKDRGRNFPMVPFWYSTILKYNGDYTNAKKFFKRSKRFFVKDKEGFYYLKVLQEIKSCESAIRIIKDSVDVDIKNIGENINTYNSELGAALLDDSTIIYSSLRDEEMKTNNEISDTSQYLVRLFRASKTGELWQQDEKLDSLINQKGKHVANGCLSPDKDLFYYNVCDANFNCKIYGIPYNGGNWGTPFELSALNIDNYTSSQPYITTIENKETIFFTSNRPGGKGGMDIWYSIKTDNQFSQPKPIPGNVNTIEDEITPFYNSDDSLFYFSSNWHEGLGGFDIFSTPYPFSDTAQITNLGPPINTSVNDFYYRINYKTAILTSNRIGSFTKKGETCCNDIYHYELPEVDTIPVYTTLEELNRYLPVKLYFHNDRPNPNSRDTLTKLNYLTTYKDYTRLYNEYRREFSNGLKNIEKDNALSDIEDLFSSHIDQGAKDLKMFTPLLLAELEKGKEITITIKGYASPLSKSDYNVNLTLRRISSLINYLNEYENGIIKPYIEGIAENGGKLNFIKVPFGEYQVVKNISDQLDDKRNSIYSPDAALERKIEIIAISENDSNQVALDGSELEKLPLLVFKDSILTFNEDEYERSFKIINNGEAPLKIFSADFQEDGYELITPSTEIPVLEPTTITIKRNPGSASTTVKFLTNCIPNIISKEITVTE